NPVAAMLDILRLSLPLANARSFICPVAALASFQKKSKLARSISSRRWSSVLLYDAVPCPNAELCWRLSQQGAIATRLAPARRRNISLRLKVTWLLRHF